MNVFATLLAAACLAVVAQAAVGQAEVQPAPKGPVRLLFDTDLGGDVDDVGAVAVLHALADGGEVEVLGSASAVIS